MAYNFFAPYRLLHLCVFYLPESQLCFSEGKNSILYFVKGGYKNQRK